MSESKAEPPETVRHDNDGEQNGNAFVDKVLSGTVTGYIVDPGDATKIPATFKDLDKENQQQLAVLEEPDGDGGVEADEELIETIFDEYWLSSKDPETGETYDGDELPTTDDVGLGFQGAVLVGFLKSIGADNEAIREAEEFMDERLNRGNG